MRRFNDHDVIVRVRSFGLLLGLLQWLNFDHVQVVFVVVARGGALPVAIGGATAAGGGAGAGDAALWAEPGIGCAREPNALKVEPTESAPFVVAANHVTVLALLAVAILLFVRRSSIHEQAIAIGLARHRKPLSGGRRYWLLGRVWSCDEGMELPGESRGDAVRLLASEE